MTSWYFASVPFEARLCVIFKAIGQTQNGTPDLRVADPEVQTPQSHAAAQYTCSNGMQNPARSGSHGASAFPLFHFFIRSTFINSKLLMVSKTEE
jgi:hypothetical protein